MSTSRRYHTLSLQRRKVLEGEVIYTDRPCPLFVQSTVSGVGVTTPTPTGGRAHSSRLAFGTRLGELLDELMREGVPAIPVDAGV